MSAYIGEGAQFRVYGDLSRSEARRLGRYDSLVGQLAIGRLSGRDFQGRVSGWRPFRGELLSSTAQAVLAALDRRRDAEAEVFEYRSGRVT